MMKRWTLKIDRSRLGGRLSFCRFGAGVWWCSSTGIDGIGLTRFTLYGLGNGSVVFSRSWLTSCVVDDCYDNNDNGCGCIANWMGSFCILICTKNNMYRYITGVDAYSINLDSKNTYNPLGKAKSTKQSDSMFNKYAVHRTHLCKLRQFRKENVKR